MADLPLRGPLPDKNLQIIADGGIVLEESQIVEVGPYHLLTSDETIGTERDFSDMVCIPGLIDSHTHLCYAGSRINDYAARISGKSYEQISKEGGGIWQSVQSTRAADHSMLSEKLISRLQNHVRSGVTTIEVKSGYGLNVDDEIKMLDVINHVNANQPVDLIPTCLAAHSVPRDFEDDRAAYLDYLLNELIPLVWEGSLAQRVDIFIDEIAFSPDEGRSYLATCKQLGFDLTIHGDQFSSGGSRLAVDLEARSVDHLECISDQDIEILSKSNTAATILPGASLGLGIQFAPARRILDQGGVMTIASDTNPGSAPMGDLLIQASLLSAYEKLSNAEVLAGITCRAAYALNLKDRGSIKSGCLADLAIFPTSDYREITYTQGTLKPVSVWKSGEMLF